MNRRRDCCSAVCAVAGGVLYVVSPSVQFLGGRGWDIRPILCTEAFRRPLAGFLRARPQGVTANL